MNSCQSTGQFSVAASVYVRAVARRRLWGVVWLPCLLLAAAAIAGWFDSRFWFLGLLLLFIIYPMALSLTWLSLAARPAMRWLLRPQEVSFHPDGITVDFTAMKKMLRRQAHSVLRAMISAKQNNRANM